MKNNLQFTIYNLKFLLFIFLCPLALVHCTLFIVHSTVYAVSVPTPTPTKKLTPSPTVKPSSLTPTPIISGIITKVPTGTEDEKVKEIRDAIKEKVNEIRDKIEKKAYVGLISQITDSTITLNNFRGKQRVRLTETTVIIGTTKKEIKISDLAVDDKIIAMGTMAENEILEATRLIVVPLPKTPIPNRILFSGNVSLVDVKKSTITLTNNRLDQDIEIKVNVNTLYVNQADTKVAIKLKDLKENQKLIVIYPEPAVGKTPIAKTIFLLP